MLSRKDLPRHVRDALANFYAPAFLQISPLTALLPEESEEAVPVQLQALIREGLAQLRPGADIPLNRPEWFPYRILQSRYLQLRHLQTICDDLAVSTASSYRYQQQAIDALADILWHLCGPESSPSKPPPATDDLTPDEQAVNEAVRLALASRHEPVDLVTLLDNVRQIFQPLAEQRGISFTLDHPASLPTVEADAAVLHQIIVNLLTEALDSNGVAALQFEVCATHRGEISGRLTGLTRQCPRITLRPRAAFGLSRRLLDVYGGHLEIESQENDVLALRFTLPCQRQQTILVIEDHEDTIQLYQRYTQQHGYALRVAHSADEAWECLTEERLPSLIILDVLMPREDGWMVLQRLKILPETAHIPVIIYSVLSQPSLALSLGAVKVLRKPVQEDVLLQALEEYLPITKMA